MSLYVEIEKNLGTFHLDVKLETEENVLALMGPSGCGKSLTLRCIAGIERPDRGRIVVDGVTLFDSERKIDLPPQQRRTGLLFQNYALFPHMTVRQNIDAGARRERDRTKREAAVENVVESLGLSPLLDHLPHQLSGGQQQRTALARILVSDPRILLLDEPFSALDSHLRARLEREVRQVLREFGKTVVLVSHDRDEVYRMADRIALMEEGVIQTMGSREAVFAAPGTRIGAALTGCGNLSAIRQTSDGWVFAEDWGIRLELPELPVGTAAIGIRMQEIRAGKGENAVACRVVEEIENPFTYHILLEPEAGKASSPLIWEVEKTGWHHPDRVTVSLPRSAILYLKEPHRRNR